MSSYRTPGVYVEEVSTLPPSVAEVSTAIPAFLGYTQKGPRVARVSTMLEFTELFGGAAPTPFTVTVTEIDDPPYQIIKMRPGKKTTPDGTNRFVPEWLLYYGVNHYFKNGGGPCYVFKVGEFSEGGVNKEKYSAAIKLLEQEDEPTLIVLTDAINLQNTDYYTLVNDALDQCKKLKNRFLILDVPSSGSARDDMNAFRNNGVTENLAYAAAYYPYLHTSLSPGFDEQQVDVTNNKITTTHWQGSQGGLTVTFHGESTPTIKIEKNSESGTPGKRVLFRLEGNDHTLFIRIPDGATDERGRAKDSPRGRGPRGPAAGTGPAN